MKFPSFFPFIRLLPKHLLSSCAGKLAEASWLPPVVHHGAIRTFSRAFHVNLEEAARPNPKNYKTFRDFFIRPLRSGSRPLEDGIVSPADGVLSQGGTIEAGLLTQVKGQSYDVASLLGDATTTTPFQGGTYATIYLSPRHYHRVHCPFDAKIVQTRYIPGELWPVNAGSVHRVTRLFARNERAIIFLETEFGKMAVVLVGATVVGHIHFRHDENHAGLCRRLGTAFTVDHDAPITIHKGDELGYFSLGSTVVLLMEGAWNLRANPGDELRMGQTLFQASGDK